MQQDGIRPEVECSQVLTKTVTSALLNAVGDIMSQVFFEEHEGIDWKRTAIFAFLVRIHSHARQSRVRHKDNPGTKLIFKNTIGCRALLWLGLPCTFGTQLWPG